ncbi:unnamed protein product [Ceutorhynchus assimilis]|uniref:Uncharacterized protein n=1 Tax=Ceutorhynchus assimilis TaxID=467358 RepID=A0A9P0DC73_9CUCU|nr:unnamed protein product [Ceutorhynchus assimilis]
MNKNITISDLNVEIQGNGNGIRKYLGAKIGICVIEFLLASVFYCYGIILSEYVILGTHKYGDGLWTSILFICSWSFTVMIPGNIIAYMIFGGLLSNLVSNQLNFFAIDKLDMDSKVFEAFRQISRALSLFIMPQIICLLITYYEVNQVKLIFGAVLFNIIPAALIIKTGEETRNNDYDTEMSRYQTIGRFSHQMQEMKSFTKENDDNLSESSSTSSKEEPVFEINPKYIRVDNGIENEASEHIINDLSVPTMHLSPVNVQSYFLNFGVSILPGIPEEDEEIDDINYINPKRLSVISSKLEELNIQDQIRRESIKEVFSINEVHKPERINTIEYIPNFKEEKSRMSVLDELKNFQRSSHCFHCSPYRKYIWTRRLRMVKDFFNDNFLRPLYHALKNLYFYPALSTKITTNLVSTLYITLAPFMAMENSWKQKMLIFSTENVTFLLTYVAFAWCFFLVGLPLVFKLNQNKIRMVFAFGLVVSGTSLWFLSAKLSNDVITISSLLFGFGYGIITYTEKQVFKTSIGMRPWYLVRGPLEVLSAVFILIIYHVIYLNKVNLNWLLFLAAMSYYFNAVLWLCMPFFKYFISIVKRIIFDERSQQEEFFH